MTPKNQLKELREWLNNEILERRDYTASRAFEEVIIKMNGLQLEFDKCTCNNLLEAENCVKNCGSMGQ